LSYREGGCFEGEEEGEAVVDDGEGAVWCVWGCVGVGVWVSVWVGEREGRSVCERERWWRKLKKEVDIHTYTHTHIPHP
jgi:hypothetical protein